MLISATYLNNIKKYSENELDTIALSLYYSKKGDIEIDEPKVEINLQSLQVKELFENDEIVQYLPVRNEWSRYFLISAPKSNEQYLNLFVEIYPFEQVLLRFVKTQ
ncbi:MAG: hypothetical protein LBP40_01455 [Campylobacteraceae bacterium]|nr:hypothetical protein [Campylobacteraceae bacterium]